jgi:tryptophanase
MNWRTAMMSQGMGKPKVELDFQNLPANGSATDLLTSSGTKADLTILISRLMQGEETGALKREYSSELVEEVISQLENRI